MKKDNCNDYNGFSPNGLNLHFKKWIMQNFQNLWDMSLTKKLSIQPHLLLTVEKNQQNFSQMQKYFSVYVIISQFYYLLFWFNHCFIKFFINSQGYFFLLITKFAVFRAAKISFSKRIFGKEFCCSNYTEQNAILQFINKHKKQEIFDRSTFLKTSRISQKNFTCNLYKSTNCLKYTIFNVFLSHDFMIFFVIFVSSIFLQI